MNNFETFLQVLKKTGYPNPKIISIANMVGYDLDSFLDDLEKKGGEKGVVKFCQAAVEKITPSKGLLIYENKNFGEFVYMYVKPEHYDHEISNKIESTLKWGDSRLLFKNEDGEENLITIQELIDEADMGEWGELSDFLDELEERASNLVYENCGFGVRFD